MSNDTSTPRDTHVDPVGVYDGAGDGQCLAIKASDDTRCDNGVYGKTDCCGTHKRASDVTLAPDVVPVDYRRCPECGWQREDWPQGGGEPPACVNCGVEFPPDADQWSAGEEELVTDGGTPRDAQDHIYVVRRGGTWCWTTKYRLAFQEATGLRIDEYDGEGAHPEEERISIMHTRGREYVLDLSSDYPYETCMNRQYECAHVAYGPPKRLPSDCPECHPVATDGGLVEDCVDCDWSTVWEGGSADDDPGLDHAKETGHTVHTTTQETDEELVTDGGVQGAIQVGKTATVRVAYTFEREVEVQMPVDGDAGQQADEKLFVMGEFDALDGERDLIHSEIVDEEPLYEDEFESTEDYPSHV